jgi:hypothetical protein
MNGATKASDYYLLPEIFFSLYDAFSNIIIIIHFNNKTKTKPSNLPTNSPFWPFIIQIAFCFYCICLILA